MKSQKAVSLLFSVAVIGAFTITAPKASAAQGALMFHGSLVNAGCEAHISHAAMAASPLKSLQAGAGVTVGLNRNDDACHQLAVPVQASYTELSSTDPDARAGIVTLTYQ